MQKEGNNWLDNDFIEAIKKGGKYPHHTTYEYIYNSLQDTIIGYIINKKGDKTLAMDTLHLSLIVVRDKIKKGEYIDEGKFLPFCFGISRNVYKSLMALSQKDREKVLTHKEHFKHFIDTCQSPYDVEKDTLISEMLLSLDDLTDNQKKLLRMYYFENHKIKVIAQLLGTSENNIKQRLRNARISLKRSLDKRLERKLELLQDITIRKRKEHYERATQRGGCMGQYSTIHS